MKLVEKVEEKRLKDGLTVRQIGYLLGITDTYYVQMRNGSRRITEKQQMNFKRFLEGEFDHIEIPKYSTDKEEKAYNKGYKKAIKDLQEFIDTKKDWLLLPIANSQSVHKIIRTLKIQNYSEVVNYD